MRVYIVDDNEPDRVLIHRAVRRIHPSAEIGEYGDPRDALLAIASRAPDVLVADACMGAGPVSVRDLVGFAHRRMVPGACVVVLTGVREMAPDGETVIEKSGDIGEMAARLAAAGA